MSERAPEALLWDFLRGATMSKALAIAADLRLAERLAEGPRSPAELAREAGVDADALHRVLRALASDGVFAEVEPGSFGNTPASETVGRAGWPEFAHLFGGLFFDAIGTLDRAVGTGSPTFAGTFGAGFYDWLAAHPAERGQFDRAMAGEKQDAVDRLAGLEWRDGEVVVDVGGGSGALMVELARRRPGLRGIVFDLPETERDETALGDRVEFVAGSFFERVPPGDTYVLSAILHGWDDERAAAILGTIARAAAAGTRLVLLEGVVATGNEPQGAKWLDLLMLVLNGGRERTEADWRRLLEGSAFEPLSVEHGLVEARRR